MTKRTTVGKERFSGWHILVIGMLCVFFAAGVNSAPAVTLSAMAENLGVDVGSVGLMFTFGGIGGIVAGLAAGPWAIKKFGSKKTMLIGSIGVFVNLLMYAYGTNLAILYASAFIGGLCGSLCGVTVLAGILGNWFIDKRSLVIGIALGVATFGSAVVQIMSGLILPIGGYPLFYIVLAVCILVFSILGNIFFLKESPEQVGQKPLGWEQNEAKAKDAGSQDAPKAADSGVTLGEALRSPSFYLLFVGVVLVAMAFMGFRGYGPTLLMSYGLDQASSANYIALVSLFGGVAIMLGGVVSEKLGNKAYLFVMIGGLIIAIAIVAFVGQPIITMPALLVLAMLFAGFASGISGAISSTVSTEAFGNKDYARIVVTFVAASNAGVMLYAAIIKGFLNVGWSLDMCYSMFFLPCSIIGLILLVLGLTFSPARKKPRGGQALQQDSATA